MPSYFLDTTLAGRPAEYNRRMRSSFRAFLLSFAIASTAVAAAPEYLTFIGNSGSDIPGFRLDTSTGKLTSLGAAASTPGPAWLALAPSGRFLYAVNEGTNGVSAFSIDSKTGKLTPLNKVATKGKGPCHASVDHTGKVLFVANYGSGSLESFPILADGSIGERASFIQNEGSSADHARQQGPHAHSANVSPDNRFLVLADLGLDKLLVFKIDPATAKLRPTIRPLPA